MATTTFVDETTVVEADWLNEVDALVWDVFNGATTVALAKTALGLGTSDSPTFTGLTATSATVTTINVENADTSITRASAGNIAVEGNVVYRAGGTTVPVGDGGTGLAALGSANESLVVNSGATALSYQKRAVVGKKVTSYTTATSTTNATMVVDNTIPQSSEGTELTTFTYTPIRSDTRLKITLSFGALDASAGIYIVIALFKDSETDAIGAWLFTPSATDFTQSAVYTTDIASPGTSAITFHIRWGSGSAGTKYVNRRASGALFGGVLSSTWEVEEYLA